jgi:hypothetical protein
MRIEDDDDGMDGVKENTKPPWKGLLLDYTIASSCNKMLTKREKRTRLCSCMRLLLKPKA